jgi:hypothetical protein
MKKTAVLVILIFATGLAFNVSAKYKPLKSDVKPEEIKSLLFFDPMATIKYIETGNEAVYNDSMSAISERILLKVLLGYRQELHLSTCISLEDTILGRKVVNEVQSVLQSVNKFGNLYCLQHTPVIDSILDSRGRRFGLCMISLGFTRVKGNYAKAKAKGYARYFLSNGWEDENPVPMNSSVVAIIFDAQKHEVAFFGASGKPESPLKEELVHQRFREAFKGYFTLN